MVTPYKLGAYEEVWEDDCSSCPAHVEFDSSATAVCERKFVDDGVCYRGDWASNNDWFGYHFEFPPEWGHGDGKVDFTYEFKYWAIGDWENNVDYAGAMYCTSTQEMATENQCTDDFDDTRNSDNTCNNWDLWTSTGGDFDAYARFEAADNGGNDLACFQTVTLSHTGWTDTTLKVGFWVWDDNVNGYGLTGDISNEAWAVSHFKITFTPPPFTSTTQTPTSTTETPTTKTPTFISTTEKPTTTQLPSTELPSTTELPATTEIPETTELPATTGMPTPSDKSTAIPMLTTTKKPSVVTSTTPVFESTAVPVTETPGPNTSDSPGGGGSGGGGGMSLMVVIGAIVGMLGALCLFGLVAIIYRRHKNKKSSSADHSREPGSVVLGTTQPEAGRSGRFASIDHWMSGQQPGAVVPGSRRVSQLMRNSPASLAGDSKPRASLLMLAGGVLTPGPGIGAPPLPPIPGFGLADDGIQPPPVPLPMQPVAEEPFQQTAGYQYEDADDGYHAADGDDRYTAYEDWMQVEGDGLEMETGGAEGGEVGEGEEVDAATGVAKLEGRKEMHALFMRMKVEAITLEQKTAAKRLDLALEVSPERMENEFQMLMQMGVDTIRITELLQDKADNILKAKGIGS